MLFSKQPSQHQHTQSAKRVISQEVMIFESRKTYTEARGLR